MPIRERGAHERLVASGASGGAPRQTFLVVAAVEAASKTEDDKYIAAALRYELESGKLYAAQQANPNAPIDEAVLAKWWDLRTASPAPRALLYYNTVSLHQGAHVKDQKGDWFADRKIHYKEAWDGLRGHLDRFYARLETSGRRVVVFVRFRGLDRHQRLCLQGQHDGPAAVAAICGGG